MSTSAKTELISTTLKNIYLRRQRATAARKNNNTEQLLVPVSNASGENINISTSSSTTQDFEDLGDFVAFWLTAFQNLFLIPRGKVDNDDSGPLFEHGDDICYIVEKVADENGCLSPTVGVKRFTDIQSVEHQVPQHVFTSPSIDWEETTYLNLLIHMCKFTLSCGILQKSSASSSGGESRRKSHHKSPKLHLRKHFEVTTYASPFKHRMDKKSSRNVLSFPNVYFLIDDFESAWDNVTLSQGQEFCVELVAEIDPKFINMYASQMSSNPLAGKQDVNRNNVGIESGSTRGHNQTTIFLGASSFAQIQDVFKRRQASNNFISSFSTLFNKKQEVPTEFINMTGPNKVGKAQVAVSPVQGDPVSSSGRVGGSSDTWEHLFSFTAATSPSPASSHRSSYHHSRRANSTSSSCSQLRLQCALHCGITYVSVPCEHIMRMIFDSPREPSLLSAAAAATSESAKATSTTNHNQSAAASSPSNMSATAL